MEASANYSYNPIKMNIKQMKTFHMRITLYS